MIKFALSYLLLLPLFAAAQTATKRAPAVVTGAEQTELYLPEIKGKKVAVFANQTSIVGKKHLVDLLLDNGIDVVKIFGPEHGFRGNASAGEHVKDGVDTKTKLPIISLYGDHKKPTASDLKNVDVVLFDIQDVGVRFYTYISSLQYVMEACIENNVPLIILDRPNPNGFYVDGPVLDPKFSSFVGMQPIPVVYGMTMGEYALMISGEQWLDKNANEKFKNKSVADMRKSDGFQLRIVTCKNYDHSTKYMLPVPPSPNLKEMQSIYWYPSIALFEGTVISEGRGTDKPFQYFGHPSLPKTMFSFTPTPNEGAKSSKCYGQKCYGFDLSAPIKETLAETNCSIQLKYLLDVYRLFPDKKNFFLSNNFIDKLAGTDQLRKQIIAGKTEAEIRKSWEPGLKKFKEIRKKYLLYGDF